MLMHKNVVFIPETISSAGAILQDSVEYYEVSLFKNVHPYFVYNFVSHLVGEKSRLFLNHFNFNFEFSPYEVASQLCDIKLQNKPLGYKFQSWIYNKSLYTDVAIVGGGIAGTAAAYYTSLRKTGLAVSVFEQSSFANKSGSSFGDSRMYREMYSDTFYSKLMSKSLSMWKDIELVSNTKLVEKNGLLFFGSSETGETAEGSIQGAAATMKLLGLKYKLFNNADALRDAYPGICPRKNDIGIFSTNDGSINASKACKVLIELAKQNGVSTYENCTVLDIDVVQGGEDRALLLLSTGNVMCVKKKLVLTAGAWTTRILREQFDIVITPEVQMVAWGHFLLPEWSEDLPQWFCFRRQSQSGLSMTKKQHGLYYGFPSVIVEGKRAVKVGIDFEPDCIKGSGGFPPVLRTVPQELLEDITSFVREHWPKVGDILDMHLSPYHTTPSQDFALGELPQFKDVIMFCGGSGRAFKFGPLIGESIASLVVNKTPDINISRFDPSRIIAKTREKNHAFSYSSHVENDSSTMKSNDFRNVFGISHVPLGKFGSGLYSLATQGCFDVIEASKPLVINAAEASVKAQMESKCGEQPISFCDFGAADGGTSLNLWTDVILTTLQTYPSDQVNMQYEDQPNADFQALFGFVQGRLCIPGRTSKSYLESKYAERIFVSAVGTSFHQQCLPTHSLTFGFSSTAMHWLSSVPEKHLSPGMLHHTSLVKGRDDDVIDSWRNVGENDWTNILCARAKELRVGGKLVLVNFCIDKDGQYLGNTKNVPRNMFREMEKQWKALWLENIISKKEYERAQILNYYRTVDEMCSPLLEPDSMVRKSGLRLEHVSTAVTKCPYRSRWLAKECSLEAFAEELVLTMRTWSNSSFQSALNPSRSLDEKTSICDSLFQKIELAVRDCPEDFGMEYVHAFMVIRKEM